MPFARRVGNRDTWAPVHRLVSHGLDEIGEQAGDISCITWTWHTAGPPFDAGFGSKAATAIGLECERIYWELSCRT